MASTFKTILLLGAGRSTNVLISYLKKECIEKGWKIRVGDISLELAQNKIANTPIGEAFQFDLFNHDQRRKEIRNADLVISMMPSHLHFLIAKDCVEFGKNMTSASYISDEIKSLDDSAKKKGITILKECGLDPGIDHMSAMKEIDEIKKTGELLAFETFTGGLLAPSKDDNPWEYKFTWNPRNVVLAGQGGVKFLQEGRYKYIPYHKVFKRTEQIYIPEYGYFEGYANRDSLRYIDVYDLKGVKTLFRGTLRKKGFCRAWDIFVQLGATDDFYEMEGVGSMTHRQFINSFLAYNPNDSIELKLAHYMNLPMDSEEMFMIRWLGLFSDELVGLKKGTPAQILEHILSKRWKLTGEDRDMIVMYHKLVFQAAGKIRQLNTYMVLEGQDAHNTAMAKTVGLPLGIASKLMLEGKVKTKGVIIPIYKDIYEPVMEELTKEGLAFKREVLMVM